MNLTFKTKKYEQLGKRKKKKKKEKKIKSAAVFHNAVVMTHLINRTIDREPLKFNYRLTVRKI